MSRHGIIRGLRRSETCRGPRGFSIPPAAIKSVILAAFLALSAPPDSQASACAVSPWRFAFGKQTSANMSASTGAICQTYLDAPAARGGTVRSIRIIDQPRNGKATALGRGLVYKSNSGFQGRDAFSFAIIGSGKRAQRTATVRVSVAVAPPRGSALPGSGPIALREYTPWLIQSRGAENAKGVFYFIAGLLPDEPDDDRHHAAQYFLKSMAEAGWDVIYAKYPQGLAYPGHEDAHKRVAAFVRERIEDLKERGYHRVILGGQSWGAWATLVAEARGDLRADALFLMAPATYGRKTALSGRPNLSFSLNRSDFATLVKAITKPAAAVFFAGDDFDPGGRDKLFEEQVRKRQLPHVLIANPKEPRGHNAGWLPAFDFRYGTCLQAFFETLASRRCEPPAASAGDFRAISHRSQISDSDAKRIMHAEQLVGRSFVVYSSGGAAWLATYQTPRSVVWQTPKGRNEQGFEFKDGRHCRGNQCRVLIRFDDKHLIAFDPKSGAASSWWVEM
jgi:pimeloyl-ACP methyl ester carboxylesterase